MIVADSSAFVAIMLDEPERDAFVDLISTSERVLVSTMSVVETRMVLQNRRGDVPVKRFNAMLSLANIEIIAPDLALADIAHTAFVRFGKGSGHPAQLNFGDLFSYALAKQRGVPLLFKGDDFARTDVARA